MDEIANWILGAAALIGFVVAAYRTGRESTYYRPLTPKEEQRAKKERWRY